MRRLIFTAGCRSSPGIRKHPLFGSLSPTSFVIPLHKGPEAETEGGAGLPLPSPGLKDRHLQN